MRQLQFYLAHQPGGRLFFRLESPPMDIGNRLRKLRQAKRLSQGDVERLTGLKRSYVSRVEWGHTIPSIATLAKWVKALDIEPYQVLFGGRGKPAQAKTPSNPGPTTKAEKLVILFERMPKADQRLVLAVAQKLAKERRR